MPLSTPPPENLHKQILDAIDRAVITTDLNGYILYWNHHAETLYGYQAEEVLGKHVDLLTTPEQKQRAHRSLARMAEGNFSPGEYDLVRKDGSILHIQVTHFPVYDDNGQQIGITGISEDITADHILDQALHRQASQLDRSYQLANMGHFEYDFQTASLFISANLRRILGFPAELAPLPLADYTKQIHPDEAARVQRKLQGIRQDGQPYTDQYRFYNATTDDLMYLNTLVEVLTDTAGNTIARANGMVQDMTKQYQAEHMLSQREAQLRAAADNIPNGALYMFDANLRYIVARGQGITLAGYSPKELEGKLAYEVLPEHDFRMIEDQYRSALAGEVNTMEYIYNGRNYQARTAPVRNDEGEIIAGILHAYDITDLKQAEAEIRQREALAQALTDSNPDLIARLNREHKLLYCNQPLRAFLEKREFDLQSINSIQDFEIPEQAKQQLQAGLNITFEIGVEQNVELIIQMDGKINYIDVRFIPEPYGATKPQTVLAIGRDVTEKHNVEQQKLEVAIEREHMRILQEFLTDTSHDLRTPLTVAGTSLYLLKRQMTDEKQLQRIYNIESALDHLKKILDSLFEMNELDITARYDREQVNLNQILGTIAEAAYPLLAEKQLHLNLGLSPEPLYIRGDTHYLRRAFENILNNAIQYTPQQGQITLHSQQDDQTATVRIADTGIGIAKKHLPHIFERFYRVDAARLSESGNNGLGLTIAHKIITSHHGSIEVKSQTGEGSQFFVRLPLVTMTT